MEKTRTDPDLSETILTFSDMLFRIALSFTKDSTASEDIIQDVFLHYMTDGTFFLDQEHKKAWLFRARKKLRKEMEVPDENSGL